MRAIFDILFYWLGMKWAKSLSKDYRSDPIYKKNVRDLIERIRRFESAKQ